MADIHKLASGGVYDPKTLNQLSDMLESIWIEVGGSLSQQQSTDGSDSPRTVIAKSLLYHSAQGHRDAATLRALVEQALRRTHPKVRF